MISSNEERIDGLIKLNKLIKRAKASVNKNFDLEFIKSLEDTVLNFEEFYFIAESDFVLDFSRIEEHFNNNELTIWFGLSLSDNSTIGIHVRYSSFMHNFYTASSIPVILPQLLDKLLELYKNKYLMVNLSYIEPRYSEDGKLTKCQLMIYGVPNDEVQKNSENMYFISCLH